MLDAIVGHVKDRDKMTLPDIMVGLAFHTGDVTLLAELATSDDADVRRAVAQNKATPPSVLQQLASDEDDVVRSFVAYNSSTSTDTLLLLASDEDEEVLEEVVRHSNVNAEVLLTLADNPNLGLSYLTEALEHPDFPVFLISRMWNHDDVDVRREVAECRECPLDILLTLALCDEDGAVRQFAARTLSTETLYSEPVEAAKLTSLFARSKKLAKELP